MDQQTEFLQYLYHTASGTVDFTSRVQHDRLYRLSEQLMDCQSSLRRAMAAEPQSPAEFSIASLLLDSREAVNALPHPIRVAVVFPMWGEHIRLQSPCHDNPYGTDALRIKLDQLSWLFDRTQHDWKLYAIDDGCPYHSGDLAAEIGSSHQHSDRLTVAWLEQQLPAFNSALRRLRHVDDSSKAGAVIHGCELALNDGADVVVYTNADNATHLGQTGLLLDSFAKGFDIALGDRDDPASIVIEQDKIQHKGDPFLLHMQRMITRELFDQGIGDVRCPFKLFSRASLEHILKQPLVFDFSFDTDWLLAGLPAGFNYAPRPLAYVKNKENTHSMAHRPRAAWFDLLTGMVSQVRKHNVGFNAEVCNLIDRLIIQPSDLDALISYLPEQLCYAATSELGNPALMSPPDIERWILQCKEYHQYRRAA